MIPVFLSEDVPDCVEGIKDDLPVRVWRYEGEIWFLAVNASYERKSAQIRIDGKVVNLDLPPLGYVLQPVNR